MPKVHIKQKTFDQLLGKQFTLEELSTLGFQFGYEVQQESSQPLEQSVIVEEKQQDSVAGSEQAEGQDQKKKKPEKAQQKKEEVKEQEKDEYVFEVTSNRIDLLSAEGITNALRIYLGIEKENPIQVIKTNPEHRIVVTKQIQQYRPFIVACILRDVSFTQESFQSFIDCQAKLDAGVCRHRQIVSTGTHDLDTIEGPFTYTAQNPEEIQFVLLAKKDSVPLPEMNGNQMMEHLSQDLYLRTFLDIIKPFDQYPVIYDNKGRVCSVPPIINGNHSQMTAQTKNVLIEMTAIDELKASQVLNTVISNFGKYCGQPFHVEEVKVVYEDTGKQFVYPNLQRNKFVTNLNYLNAIGTFNLQEKQAIDYLEKMGHEVQSIGDQNIEVTVPIWRSDVIHQCDIAEDVCIAFGYNKVKPLLPAATTFGQQVPLNKVSDLVRRECAMAGYIQGLTFTLCSKRSITTDLLIENDPFAVTISNPKTVDTETARTRILPGLLKLLQTNIKTKLPIQFFELGDVVLKEETHECGAKNQRRLCAIYVNKSSEMEIIHGLLDHIMTQLRVQESDYKLTKSNIDTYFGDRQAYIQFQGEIIGTIGTLHPRVLENFKIVYPISTFEINIEKLIENFLQLN